MGLREIIAGVEGTRRTLSLCNVDAPGEALDAIGGFFDPQHVAIRWTTTEDGVPKNVAILHDGDEFVAASGLRAVYEYVDPAVGANTATDIEDVDVPDVVRGIDDTTFSDYGKQRMIIASREIEKAAWRAGRGTLHAGFQRLSLVASQRRIYEKLAADLDVHLYGVPDAEPPPLDATVHGHDADEIAASWFVVHDGDGENDAKCALLARETPEVNTYRGF
ncbi:MAG: DICT sensory domain-containing protein [Haloarculaceae archaeon]